MKNWMICVLAAMLIMVAGTPVSAEDKPANDEVPPVLKFKMKSLRGKTIDLSQYKGKVLLITNTASKCGATPQYEPLQTLHEKYSKDGLAVLGFPCNQFGAQEPGTEADIAEFCQANYGVEFDMFAKIDVKGEKQADLYKLLTSKETFAKDPGTVKWNFEKFLVGRDGNVVARFRTPVSPDSPEVVKAIETELKKK